MLNYISRDPPTERLTDPESSSRRRTAARLCASVRPTKRSLKRVSDVGGWKTCRKILGHPYQRSARSCFHAYGVRATPLLFHSVFLIRRSSHACLCECLYRSAGFRFWVFGYPNAVFVIVIASVDISLLGRQDTQCQNVVAAVT